MGLESSEPVNNSPTPLFHGTSTLFLDGIIKSGLGGMNPISEWKILEFAQAIYPLVKEHVSHERELRLKALSFSLMVEQKSTTMNFQHGDSYLSPVSTTAIRYAVDKRFGSELLSYTLDFLQELVWRKIPGVADDLYRHYPHIFKLLDISVAPLLIEVPPIPATDLEAEGGGDATATLDHIRKTLRDDKEYANVLLQQSNFRLRRPVPANALKLWLINVTHWDQFNPEYTLYQLYATEGRRISA